MKYEFDFSNAKRGAVVPLPAHPAEVRLRLTNKVLNLLRARVIEADGGSYRDIIDIILQAHIQTQQNDLHE